MSATWIDLILQLRPIQVQEKESREDLKINFIFGTPLKHITHAVYACIFLLISRGFCGFLFAKEASRMSRLKNKNFIHTLVKQGPGYEIILWLNHRTDHESSPRGRTGGQLYHYQNQMAFPLPCGALSLDCLRFCCKSLEMRPRPPPPRGKGQLGIHARCGSADNFQPDGRGQVLHSTCAAGLIQKGRTSFSTV